MAISRYQIRCRAIAAFVTGLLGCAGIAQVADAQSAAAQTTTARTVVARSTAVRSAQAGSRHSAPLRRTGERPRSASFQRTTTSLIAGATYLGGAFDTCAAPAVSTMAAWWGTSQYQAAGIYLGGINRACPDGNLSADWVHQVSAQGWRLIPAYVGRQAPCVTAHNLSLMDPATAPAQAVSAADDAAARAAALGIEPGSAIYFDLENYRRDSPSCTSTVMHYIDSWVRELHSHGYLAGVYSSAGSGIADLVSAVGTPGWAVPDALWIARWDANQTTADSVLPPGYWSAHQRIKQFAGGHKETHGPVTIDVDGDYVDGPVAIVH
jgi:hypothetical protein